VASTILILLLMWIFFRLQVGEFYFSGESIAKLSRDMASWTILAGRGSIFGTFFGGLVMATVIQGVDYTNLENWLQLVVRGSVLVLAVGLNVAAKNPPCGHND
jgi:ABC-type xylose transport system permease subunit